MDDKIVNLEEKRSQKEYKETGKINVNSPFTPEWLANSTPSLWQRIKRYFRKEDIPNENNEILDVQGEKNEGSE